MKPAELAARRNEVRREAAGRWRLRAPAVARTAAELARGGPKHAASSERLRQFETRERLKSAYRTHGVGFERIIGDTNDLDERPPSDVARRAGRPVARVVELLDDGGIGEGFATAFLVGQGLVLTNWHVFGNEGEALGAGVQFGFEVDEQGFMGRGVVFELDPRAFFHADEELDIALVAVKPAPISGSASLQDYDRVRLIPSLGKILVGQSVSIIQHPDGRHKHWAIRQNKLLVEPPDNDPFITYTTDTLEGSSGSPAFNHDWELVGVHHSGVPRMVDGEIKTRTGASWRPGMPDTEIDWVANEGARVSKIVAYLRALKLADVARQARIEAVLSDSTDPLLAGPAPAALESMPALPPVRRSLEVMNIVVNGTANFHVALPQVGEAPGPKPPQPDGRLVTAEKKLRFDPRYGARPGYDPRFLAGFDVPAPAGPLGEVLRQDDRPRVLDYHNYSLVMHKKRRLAMWAASNVDYDPDKRWRQREEFGDDTWKPDPRIPIEAQIEDVEFYDPAKKFDRGHIVRRDDVAWGRTRLREEYGNSDSFHWTNCTPQHEGFNRDAFGFHGLWGQLENHIAKQAGFVQDKLIIFAGPILDAEDPSRDFGSGTEVQVPIAFWKVVLVVEDTQPQRTLRAYGFVLDQSEAIDEFGWEGRFKVGKFKEHQVSIAEITTLSRVTFDQVVHDADPLRNAGPGPESRRRPLASLESIRLR